MFELINRKASIGVRVAMIAAFAAPPIALLIYLFVVQVSQGIDITQRELAGADYIGEIWPALLSQPGSPAAAPISDLSGKADARDVALHTASEAKAFAAAGADAKLSTGVILIRAVGDASSLTLDDELATYYAMDAVTVKLPRLLAATVALERADQPETRGFAMGQLTNFADASAYDFRRAIANDQTGSARQALAARAASLAAAVRRLREQPESAALGAALQAEIDQTWRADRAELIRMLQARLAKLRMNLIINLSLVTISLFLASALMVATAGGVTGRLRGLLRTMDRLNAGNTSVEIPYLSDGNETGRIAATLAAFKQGLINAVEERRQVEAANAALSESEERYRLLADNATDLILCYGLDARMVYASPSVRRYGYRPEDLIGLAAAELVHPGRPERGAGSSSSKSFKDDPDAAPSGEPCSPMADGSGWKAEPTPILDEEKAFGSAPCWRCAISTTARRLSSRYGRSMPN